MFKKTILKIGIISLVITVLLSVSGCISNDNEIGNNVVKEQSIDEVVIIKSEITSSAQFYPILVNGIEMEVMAVRASDGTIRTAFNACVVCGSSGRGYYVQEGDEFICQNCGNRYKIDQIETERGGCNPAPIMGDEKIETEDTIIIPKETFEKYEGLY